MGRGVEVPSNALVTVYTDWSPKYEDWAENMTLNEFDPEDITEELFWEDHDYFQWEWDANREWFIETVKELWPSFEDADDWLGYPYRETSIVLQNNLVRVTISEYCGMTALSIIPQEDYYGNPLNLNLAAQWVRQIEGKFRETFGDYYRLGTFSNGEGVYGKAS